MTASRDLERELRSWLAEYPAPYRHDSVEEILLATAGTSQRPRWTFPERWLPMTMATLGIGAPRVPWRTILVLAALAGLLALAIGTQVGSPTPSPYGLAGNGLIAIARDGEIYVADPVTGIERPLVVGPETDHEPRWSLDGTRLAFLRSEGRGERVVTVGADGQPLSVSAGRPWRGLDIDSLAWAPDGRTFSLAGDFGGRQMIQLIDTDDGRVSQLEVDYDGMEFMWRPPDGRQVLFLGRDAGRLGLFLVTVADGAVTPVVMAEDATQALRPIGWTPDGTRFAFDRSVGNSATGLRTHIVDLVTGETVPLDVSLGRLSNDGSRVVGITVDGRERLCIAGVGGGPCNPVGTMDDVPMAMTSSAFGWSPDDAWLFALPAQRTRVVVIEARPSGAVDREWEADGTASWQRIAP